MRHLLTEVRDLLAPLDPAAHDEPPPAGGTADARMHRIMAGPRAVHSARQGRARRLGSVARVARAARPMPVAAVVGIMTVATVAAFVLLSRPATSPPALAATPAPLAFQHAPGSARQMLDRIAQRAADLPADPAQSGRYEHLRIDSWSLTARIDGRQVTSAVIPERRDVWRAADDSGRIVVHRLAPLFPNESYRRAWDAQGRPGSGRDQVTEFSAGEFGSAWSGRPPTDPTALARWLTIGHPTSNGPAETLVAATDLVAERVLAPAERAALLRVLARVPGLSYAGRVTDRAGRAGVGFSLDSAFSGLPTRYTLIVDPATGRVLDYEETLTRTAGRLHVGVPSVIGYDVFLTADHTDTVH